MISHQSSVDGLSGLGRFFYNCFSCSYAQYSSCVLIFADGECRTPEKEFV